MNGHTWLIAADGTSRCQSCGLHRRAAADERAFEFAWDGLTLWFTDAVRAAVACPRADRAVGDGGMRA